MSGLFNPTVAWITTRATLGRKRALLFWIPAVILIAVTAALRASRPPSRPWPSHVLGTFGFSVLLPLTALIIGSSVLGAEIDDGSVIHLLATPVRRSSVIFTKFAVATVLTMIFAAVPELIAALISGGGNTAPTVTVTPGSPPVVVPGAVVNSTDFAVGLLVVLIWEALLSNFVSGARLLSVSHYSLGIANGIAHDVALGAGLTVLTSVVMGAVVTVAALVVAVNLLSSFTLKGD